MVLDWVVVEFAYCSINCCSGSSMDDDNSLVCSMDLRAALRLLVHLLSQRLRRRLVWMAVIVVASTTELITV